jgi:alkylation response protein AidB-like acyl-CoA dehydrogenase
MQFSFSDEQEQFRDGVQRFVRDKSPTTEVRRVMESSEGFDRDVWQQLCQDLGLAGIHIPEAYGGAGFGCVELCIGLEEMGRGLLCSPYFGSAILATSAILHGADDAQKSTLLPLLASGEKIASLAIAEAAGNWDGSDIALTATPSNDGFLLDGSKQFVLDGHIADIVIVVARTLGTSGADGIGMYLVEGDANGLQRRAVNTIDATRRLAQLQFSGVRAQLLNSEGNVRQTIARVLDEGAIALANEMIGGAQALLDATVEYAQLRMQFGRVIGSFQAVKHKCAEMLLDVELAKSAGYYAAQALDDGDPEVSSLASFAKATASDTYMRTAIESIQLHGGIGFTWDHDTHLWYKRAKSSEVFLGDPSYHRERYISCLEAQA